MIPRIRYDVLDRLRMRFARLYGEEEADRCLRRLVMLVGRYGVGVYGQTDGRHWDQTDSVLITYADTIRNGGESTLLTLHRFMKEHFLGAFSAVHLLPFFPYSSDDGFSVIHYRHVRPELGGWPDVRAIGGDFDLMVDLVLNHVSSQSGWFRDYQMGIAPGRHFFMEADPNADGSQVVRPRTTPLWTPTPTREGERHVWTTFSPDQVDLNYGNPDVLFEILDILLFYISQGARLIRLDAIAYLWKRIGTPCIHLPETYEVVRIFRDFLEMAAPSVLLLTETNVPHAENVSYFGDGDAAHLVYQFSLPPLILHGLLRGTARFLTAWARALKPPPAGCAFLNFTASHDGIGVRPLAGLVPAKDLAALARHVKKRGGLVSSKTDTDGSESPYELNISYFDALGGSGLDPEAQGARFLCSQTIPLSLRGIPAVYFHSLTATPNDTEGVRTTGRARSINRRQWKEAELRRALADEGCPTARVFAEYLRRLRLRAGQPAFHPDGKQEVLELGDACLAVRRTSPDRREQICAVHNLSRRKVEIDAGRCFPGKRRGGRAGDLLAADRETPLDHPLALGPWQVAWLKPL